MAKANGSFTAMIIWPGDGREPGTYDLAAFTIQDREDTFVCGNESVQATVNSVGPNDVDFEGSVRCWPSDSVGDGDGSVTTLVGHAEGP
jgi:hypothetical protein